MAKFAALFDMDGVLVDNFAVHLEAWDNFCKSKGLTISSDDLKNFAFGRTNDEILPHFFGRSFTKTEIDELADEKEAMYRQIYKGKVEPVKGLAQFVKALKAAGIPVAVATSAPAENAHFVLNEIGLSSYFDCITDSSMIHNGKPDPEIYLITAQRLGYAPSNCIVFEDSFAGIASGNAAGMNVVGIATTHAPAKLAGCKKVVENFESLTIEELLSW